MLTDALPSRHLCAAGMLLELLVFYVNTYQLGNSFSLWLGIQPADTFLYVFLPALLLESSCRLDFFLFKKFIVQATSPPPPPYPCKGPLNYPLASHPGGLGRQV